MSLVLVGYTSMRSIMSFFIIALFTFGLVCNEASAKRFGGGRSFGTQRSMSSFSSAKSSQSSGLMGKNANTNKWGGVLGGLLVGGLLASLFMGNGLASGLLSWLAVGAVIFFLINFFRRRMQPGFQTAQPRQFNQNSMDSFKQNLSEKYQQFTSANSEAIPAGFVADDFLREAKVKFIRLQAAYDQQNMDDIAAFTTPEVLAEIQMQFHEQEGEPNQTEVVSLEAELLGTSNEADSDFASVRFTGSIKENSDTAGPLNEIWHFRKEQESGNWIISGIQQTTPI